MAAAEGRKEVKELLKNIPPANGDAKPDGKPEAAKDPAPPRVLNELESLKVEIITKDQLIMNLKGELLEAQKKTLAVQEENLKLQKAAQVGEASKLIADLGMSGSINLVKNAEGRYVVNNK